ncbi:MAG: tetraacyldisaccharide 4'-kinase [Fibrobacteres bacterium]|nr:tetraacyldisaccharide 4'-kinase [Fibrobacterota bacterium]
MKGGLFIASLVFAAATTARKLLFDFNILKVNKLSVPVISVGNITAGGTGKTPVVILIGQILKEAGVPVAVLSRGYGRKSMRPFSVRSGKDLSAQEIGDEPKLISEKLDCPLGIASNRYRTANLLIRKFGEHVMVMDDGFSHRQLHRDLNILLVDAENPFGNGFLPKGRLREPLSSLKRAEVVIITGDINEERVDFIRKTLKRKGFAGEIFTARRKVVAVISPDGAVLPDSSIKGKDFYLFSGIAGHEKFENSAKELGIEIKGSVSYPDHYPFDKSEIDQLIKNGDGAPLLTTEKDIARIGSTMNCLYALRINIEIDRISEFKGIITRLKSRIS